MAKTPSFEKSMQELNGIVEKMEQGNENLEDSLNQFEQGIKLSKACQKLLDSAEQKVQILTKNNKLEDHDAD